MATVRAKWGLSNRGGDLAWCFEERGRERQSMGTTGEGMGVVTVTETLMPDSSLAVGTDAAGSDAATQAISHEV
jgi:hypothetical protein